MAITLIVDETQRKSNRLLYKIVQNAIDLTHTLYELKIHEKNSKNKKNCKTNYIFKRFILTIYYLRNPANRKWSVGTKKVMKSTDTIFQGSQKICVTQLRGYAVTRMLLYN